MPVNRTQNVVEIGADLPIGVYIPNLILRFLDQESNLPSDWGKVSY